MDNWRSRQGIPELPERLAQQMVATLPVVIPCHRVIGGNGKLTGYAGGLAIKEKLLKLEQVKL